MIYIQILDYKWYPLDYEDMHLEEEIAKTFVKQVKHAIDTQKFNFTPLSPQYLQYKRKRGLSLHMWEATSQLKNSLSYYRNGDTITIGWDVSLRHKESKLKVYQIASMLEYGTMTIPPRPLFRTVLRYYQSQNIDEYFRPTPKSGVFTPKVDKEPPQVNKKVKESFIKKTTKKIKDFFKMFKKR